MRKWSLALIVGIVVAYPLALQGAEIEWTVGFLDEEEDVSSFGTVVEAYAFTGENGRNALDGTFPLVDPFEVNGTTFVPLNFTLGEEPDSLEGLTYFEGEYGHTTAEEGYEAILAALAFESGIGEQFMELTNLTVGQDYQVEFYYYHRTVNRNVTFDDNLGNTATVNNRGYASGYFIADGTSQEILAIANTGSQFLNGYQLREVPGPPPIIEPPLSDPALIGYWNFDDNTLDSSGRDNHGTISGGVSYDTDVPAALGAGKSALFDGVVDTHVQVEHNSMMPVTAHTNFTISMWVKGDGTIDNNDDRIFSEGSSLSNNPLFNLGTQVEGLDGRLDFYYRNNTSTGHVFSLEEPFDDEWHHVLWVDENNIGTLYIDGAEDTTFDYSTHPPFEADITSIGSVLRASDCCNFTGNIDDVAAWSFILTEDDIVALANGASPLDIPIPGTVPGDFDGDGLLTSNDINMLTDEVIKGDDPPALDLDNDSLVNLEDHRVWVEDLKYTWFGDANLDLEFNSSDMVQVFSAGKYESEEDAGWEEGDWNGDGIFNTSDMVKAFVGAGYEKGPRPAVAAVPEPSAWILLALGLLGLSALRRRISAST
jgi:hypothetical protein